MRGALLFAAGLFAGLAVHLGMAQNARGGVVMMNHVGKAILANITRRMPIRASQRAVR